MRPPKELEDWATQYQGEIERFLTEIGFRHGVYPLLRANLFLRSSRVVCWRCIGPQPRPKATVSRLSYVQHEQEHWAQILAGLQVAVENTRPDLHSGCYWPDFVNLARLS
jgi:hypothetical protein